MHGYIIKLEGNTIVCVLFDVFFRVLDSGARYEISKIKS